MALTLEARRHGIFNGEAMSVKEIMDTWTLQTGFPCVTVTRNYTNNIISLRQERFMFIESNSSIPETNKNQKNLWWIPISYTSSTELDFVHTEPELWMSDRTTEFSLDLSPESWIIMNIQVTGYYRVNYDQENWNLISNHLNNPNRYEDIAAVNRAQLIDDALNLARADLLDYQIAFSVTKYLKHEIDYVPWKSALTGLLYIDSMLIRSADYDKFRNYFLRNIENVYAEVGFQDIGDLLTVLKRVDILNAACHLGMKDCVSNCMRQYYNWMNEANPDINNPISPNLRNLVYCTAIKHGDQIEWDFAWERYQNTTVSSEKEILLSSLGCTREPWILARFLERSISEKDQIRKQDTFRVFSAVSNNIIGQPIAFSFICDNWMRLKEFFSLGSSMSNLHTMLKYATKKITHRSQLHELKNFAANVVNDTGRTIQQVMERAEANIAWIDKNYQNIVTWLNEQI